MSNPPNHQQEFIAKILKDKKNGYYVELGAADPINGNNTNWLESEYDWIGVGIELDENFANRHAGVRKNPCIVADALTFDYRKYFEDNNFPKQIDYLQIDVDSGYDYKGTPAGKPNQSLLALLAIPLNVYRFSVIMFEHEYLIDPRNILMRDAQREIMRSLGYSLVKRLPHEDWWVDPEVIPHSEYKEFHEMHKAEIDSD